MTTLLVLYRRPEGGAEALETFERRYTAEHLPLVAATPGLRETRVQRVAEALGGETDLVLVTAMRFDDRAALDAGLASDAMRAAGRNLREIAPGLATFLVVEDAPEMDAAASPGKRYCPDDTRGAAVTDTAPPNDRPRDAREQDRPTLVRVAYPAPAPRAAAPATTLAGVALVTLDRPKALNALSFDLLDELATALETLDADSTCRAIVLTGAGERAFAAGADILELASQTPATLTAGRRFDAWDRLGAIGLPLIAAVRGFALGGGCELAMTCDLIVAAEDASFGQPEIQLGVMPGAGGTQRLTRAIGKARAMEMILTGRPISAREAEARGLVTRVVPADATLDAALELAAIIATMPPRAVRAAKAAILDTGERSLSDGLARERQAFFALFDTDDQTEGMAAFTEKRPPVWSGH